ncbi:hypothetical protein [Blautia hansenii]|uniref:hypothetical protein n=1 Tax=Blautia hansenii TaxID=1322 RepID=UPI0039844DFA
MRKRIKTLVCALAVSFAAFSIPVYAEKGKDISFVLPLEAGQGFTSLKFSAQVNNVSKDAKVSVDFSKNIPRKTITKTTYKNGVLTVYLAGGDELFAESSLDIGELTVKNDENKGKDVFVELLPETVELVNSGYMIVEDIESVRDEIKLTGSATEQPEEPDEKPEQPEQPEEPDEKPEQPEEPDEKPEQPEEPDEKPEQPEEPEDKPELAELRNLLDELSRMDPKNYTQESWNNLSNLMGEAGELLESGTATTAQIQEMIQKLEKAKENLQPSIPSSDNTEQAKKELETFLKELDQLTSSDYTTDSWNQLYTFIEDAREMLKKGASKSEYDAMTAKLREASGKLVKAEEKDEETGKEETKPNTSGKPVKPQSGVQNVLTGDNAPIVALMFAGIASIVILGVICSKKMRKK